MNLIRKLSSRKLWVTIVSAAVVVATELTGLDLTDVETAALALVSAAYVLGEALIDASRQWGSRQH